MKLQLNKLYRLETLVSKMNVKTTESSNILSEEIIFIYNIKDEPEDIVEGIMNILNNEKNNINNVGGESTDRLLSLFTAKNLFERSFPNFNLSLTDLKCIHRIICEAISEGLIFDEKLKFFSHKGLIYKGEVYFNIDIADDSTVYETIGHVYLLKLKASDSEKYKMAFKIAMAENAMVEIVKNKYPNLETNEQIADKVFALGLVEELQKAVILDAQEKQNKFSWISKIKEWISK